MHEKVIKRNCQFFTILFFLKGIKSVIKFHAFVPFRNGKLILETLATIENEEVERKKYAVYLKNAFRETMRTCHDTECTVERFCERLAAYSVFENQYR